VAKSAHDAFTFLKEEARYNYGHAGYTGTIAEKDTFDVFPVPEGVRLSEWKNLIMNAGLDGDIADSLSISEQNRLEVARGFYGDKWGPAVCIPGAEQGPGQREYLFIGWASS
jgi:hypothetical protein